jgi:transmembrane sensor
MMRSDATGAGEANGGELTAAERQALNWISVLTSGSATNHDIEAMERWRGERPENARAMERISRVFHVAEGKVPPNIEHLRGSILTAPLTRRAALGGATAAAALYLVARPPLGAWPSLAELSSDYRTQIGERRQIALASGISLELNTGTSITNRNEPGIRGLEVVSGEIAVKANLSEGTIFRAYLADGTVSATQALVDVRRTDAGFRATCIEGSATVNQNGKDVAVSAGEQLDCVSGGSPGRPRSIDVGAATAWRHGVLVFYNAPLHEVVAEINRYRRGNILIMSSQLAGRRLNGNFLIDRLDDMAPHLAAFAHANATTLPGGIVLLSA